MWTFAKLCRRHGIPFPGRGYWARIQFGQKPERTTLPPLKEPRLDTIRIFPSAPKCTEDVVLEEDEMFPTIHVADVRPISHLIAHRIEKSMTKNRTDDRGFLHSRRGRIVPIKLTAEDRKGLSVSKSIAWRSCTGWMHLSELRRVDRS